MKTSSSSPHMAHSDRKMDITKKGKKKVQFSKKVKTRAICREYHSSSEESEPEAEYPPQDDDDVPEEDSEGPIQDDFEIEDERDGDQVDRRRHAGLANVMTKLLAAEVNSKTVILAKAKKDRDMQPFDPEAKKKQLKADSLAFEVVNEDGTTNVVKPESKSRPVNGPRTNKRRLLEAMTQLTSKKATDWDRQQESRLNSIATRGVVQLFNTINQQRSLMSKELEKVGPSEKMKDKVLTKFTKDTFMKKLDMKNAAECDEEHDKEGEEPQPKKKKRMRKNQEEEKKKLHLKKVFSDKQVMYD